MDTPPVSVATPPAQHRLSQSPACDSVSSIGASAATYSSSDLLSLQYKQAVLVRPPVPRSTSARFDVEHSTTPTNYMAGAGWKWADNVSAPVASNCSQPPLSGLLAGSYDPLTDYEAELSPVPFHYAGGCPLDYATPRPSCHLPHDAVRATGPCSPRSSAAAFPRQTRQGDRLDEVTDVCFNTAANSTPGALRTACDTSVFPFSASPRPYDGFVPTQGWKNWGYGSFQLPVMVQPRLSASPNSAATSAKLPSSRRVSRKQTAKEEANFQCSVEGCGKFFSRSYNFKSHMETHDEQREYPFPCLVSGCAKKFVRKTDLQRHHHSVHKKRNHRCDYCGRLFARKDTLRRHMEDGCSKRFDIETLDLRSKTYDVMISSGRGLRSGPRRVTSVVKILPPMSASQGPSFEIVRNSDMKSKGQFPDCILER